MKGLGTMRGPHAVDLHHDEAELGYFVTSGGEAFGDVSGVGPGVDLFNDRILFGGIKIARLVNDTVDVGGAVTAFGDKALGHFPSDFIEMGNIGFLQNGDKGAILGVAEFGDWREIDTRQGVDEEFTVG